jgi:hypothetical protein
VNIFEILLKLFIIVPAFIFGLTQFLYSLSHDDFQGELHFYLPPLAVLWQLKKHFNTTDTGNLQCVIDIL